VDVPEGAVRTRLLASAQMLYTQMKGLRPFNPAT
jgi:hypothetical protein